MLARLLELEEAKARARDQKLRPGKKKYLGEGSRATAIMSLDQRSTISKSWFTSKGSQSKYFGMF